MESGFQVRNEACTFSQEVGRVLLYLQVVTSALSGSSLRHFKELHRSICSIETKDDTVSQRIETIIDSQIKDC